MTSRVRCFMLEPTDAVELSLRRFKWSSEGKCPGRYGYHNASAVIERTNVQALKARGWPADPVHGLVHTIDSVPHADPRWPARCECGYAFADGDQWQCNPHQLFRRSDNGELVVLHDAPAGAMWDATWFRDQPDYCGPDGRALCVKLPGGAEWMVDGPAWSNGQRTAARGWSRTGTPPDITANPSILVPGEYHGFLRAGWLEEC